MPRTASTGKAELSWHSEGTATFKSEDSAITPRNHVGVRRFFSLGLKALMTTHVRSLCSEAQRGKKSIKRRVSARIGSNEARQFDTGDQTLPRPKQSPMSRR